MGTIIATYLTGLSRNSQNGIHLCVEDFLYYIWGTYPRLNPVIKVLYDLVQSLQQPCEKGAVSFLGMKKQRLAETGQLAPHHVVGKGSTRSQSPCSSPLDLLCFHLCFHQGNF